MLYDFLIEATTWRDASLDKVDTKLMDPREKPMITNGKIGDCNWNKWELFLYANEDRRESEIVFGLELKIDIVELKGG